MDIEFDPKKDAANLLKHGLSLTAFRGFDREPKVLADARIVEEVRLQAFGRIAGKGYCLVVTVRGENIRAISFRRAREKEMRRHER